jgi:benzodiazapine receptor
MTRTDHVVTPARRSVGTLLLLIAVPEIVGGLEAKLFPTGDSAWFRHLKKPSYEPPSWLFGIVWPVLYLLMGIASYRFWQCLPNSPVARRAWRWYWVQFIIQAAWTPVFFGRHAIGRALVVIIALWLVLLPFLRRAREFDRKVMWLLVPYFVWVTFAVTLNYGFWVLND